MTNHPNRNWRVRMRAALADYEKTAEFEMLTQVPIASDRFIEGMENRIKQAYKSGFDAGRQKVKHDKE